VLALCVAAALSQDTTLTDVVTWVSSTPQEVLAAVGARRLAGVWVAPRACTVLGVLCRLDRSDAPHHDNPP
jgi:hypothetical protein